MIAKKLIKRSRLNKGCEFCTCNGKKIVMYAGDSARYCKYCGRKLTEKGIMR